MGFWSRLKQLKPRFHPVLNEFRRCYVSNHLPNASNLHTSARVFLPVSDSPSFLGQSRQLELFGSARFYAAPFQANQMKEDNDKKGPRLNEEITTQFVRLVTDEGHSVVSRYDALAQAKTLNMDLVEVDKMAKPPVCKIMDYNREKYNQQIKEKEKGRAKSKLELKKGAFKEVRFAGKIKQNDLQFKANSVKRLMESGYRVKCTAVDPTDKMDLETLLSRFVALIEDVAIQESKPQVEKKQAFVVVRHVKFGPAKKSGKKASTAIETSTKDCVSTLGAISDIEHQVSSDEMSEEDTGSKKSEWAVFSGDDDIEEVFVDDAKKPELESSAFSRANTSKPTPPEVPKHVVENRYARNIRPNIQVDMNGNNVRSSRNSVPSFPAQGRQTQFGMNQVPGSRQPPSHSSVGSSSSDYPGAGTPLNLVRHSPFQAPRPQFNMGTPSQISPNSRVEGVSKHDSYVSSSPSNSPTNSYGMFSSGQRVEDSQRGQNPTVQTNRYMKRDPADSQRNPSIRDSRSNWGPGTRGIFNSDNSNVVPKTKNENQT